MTRPTKQIDWAQITKTALDKLWAAEEAKRLEEEAYWERIEKAEVVAMKSVPPDVLNKPLTREERESINRFLADEEENRKGPYAWLY